MEKAFSFLLIKLSLQILSCSSRLYNGFSWPIRPAGCGSSDNSLRDLETLNSEDNCVILLEANVTNNRTAEGGILCFLMYV